MWAQKNLSALEIIVRPQHMLVSLSKRMQLHNKIVPTLPAACWLPLYSSDCIAVLNSGADWVPIRRSRHMVSESAAGRPSRAPPLAQWLIQTIQLSRSASALRARRGRSLRRAYVPLRAGHLGASGAP